MQINELFSGTPLSDEAQVFSVEINNAAGSRFVSSTITLIDLLMFGHGQHSITTCQHL